MQTDENVKIQLPGCNLFLIGFMGTGKSTIAGKLNSLYGMGVVEMDQLIEERNGMKISEIFAKKGEPYFREEETKLLKELENDINVVISCGGGTAMRRENVDIMKKSGRVVWLTAGPETIYDRVKDDHNRPLLENNKTVAYIEELLTARTPKYKAAADFSVATDSGDVEMICREIVKKARAY